MVGFIQDEIWDIGVIVVFFVMLNWLVNVVDMCVNDEFYMLG